MSTSVILETRQLSLQAGDKKLCHQLDWQIRTGERWAILGLNGAGKTTLLHAIAGLQKFNSGEIFLHGTSIQTLARKQIAQHIGLLLQESHELFPAQVLEYVLIGRHPHLGKWQWESDNDVQLAYEALQKVDLDGFAQRDITSLSGGERQRMAIAAVLIQQPELFLLDEPVNHLDWHHQHKLLQEFNSLATRENKTLVMAIHDVNLAVRYCDHVLMMHADGEIRQGKTEEMLQIEELSRLYGHTVRRIPTDEGDLFMPERNQESEELVAR